MGGFTEESRPLKKPVSYLNKSFHTISVLRPPPHHPHPILPTPMLILRFCFNSFFLRPLGHRQRQKPTKKNHKKANKTSTSHRKLIPTRSENCFAPKLYHANGNMLIKPFASPILFSFLHLFFSLSLVPLPLNGMRG